MKLWIHGLITALISGASSAVLASFAVPTSVNWTHDGMIAMAKIAGGGIVLGVLAYFKQSPLPSDK